VSLDFSLQPVTEPGRRLVAAAEGHVPQLTATAPENDRTAAFPFASIEALHASGVLGACVPAELGGMGVESIHDFVTGINRLGRGEGSTAIAVNMHVSQTWLLGWYWRSTRASGLEERASALAAYLRQIASQRLLMCSAVAEPGTDILHPNVEVARSGSGWRLSGRKMFGSLSPAAQILQVTCKLESPQGPRFAIATVARSLPGVEIQDNWDALGMRASGSHDVIFKDCALPDYAVAELGPWGAWCEAYLAGNVVITLGLVGAFLGIAEAARDLVVATVTSRRKGSSGRTLAERPAIQHVIAEIEVDLAAARAVLDRTSLAADAYLSTHFAGSCSMDELHQLMKDFQCTKWIVARKAVDIVDKALTASGGSGYLSKNPLSRLYRDVRAGSFMQPFSPNEAFEYIGKVTLGLPPDVAN
jgi:L-evernosamine nitrososynthase